MRWTVEEPKHGDIKVKRFFAVFPVKIGNEIRWLEFVTVEFIYEDNLVENYWVMNRFL